MPSTVVVAVVVAVGLIVVVVAGMVVVVAGMVVVVAGRVVVVARLTVVTAGEAVLAMGRRRAVVTVGGPSGDRWSPGRSTSPAFAVVAGWAGVSGIS